MSEAAPKNSCCFFLEWKINHYRRHSDCCDPSKIIGVPNLFYLCSEAFSQWCLHSNSKQQNMATDFFEDSITICLNSRCIEQTLAHQTYEWTQLRWIVRMCYSNFLPLPHWTLPRLKDFSFRKTNKIAQITHKATVVSLLCRWYRSQLSWINGEKWTIKIRLTFRATFNNIYTLQHINQIPTRHQYVQFIYLPLNLPLKPFTTTKRDVNKSWLSIALINDSANPQERRQRIPVDGTHESFVRQIFTKTNPCKNFGKLQVAFV